MSDQMTQQADPRLIEVDEALKAADEAVAGGELGYEAERVVVRLHSATRELLGLMVEIETEREELQELKRGGR